MKNGRNFVETLLGWGKSRTPEFESAPTAEVQPVAVEVNDKVASKVDGLLCGNDGATTAYLVRELLRMHGIKAEVSSEEKKVEAKLRGKIKKGVNLEKVYLDLLTKHEGGSIESGSYSSMLDVSFKGFQIRLSEETFSGKIQVSVKLLKEIGERELTTIKEIFEKTILPNGEFDEVPGISEQFIAERLGLAESDTVIINDNQLRIEKVTEENSSVTLEKMLERMNAITSSAKYSEQVFINVTQDPLVYGTGKQGFNLAVAGEIVHGNPIEIDFAIGKTGISWKVKLPNASFNRKFVTGIFTQIIKEVSKLANVKNEESIVDYLTKMGITVIEHSKEENGDLQSLYRREGLVGYEDIKEHIENGVIHAWKNKAEFERIAKEKFGNIKDIIPNAVLFEGPAGTGKTTLARIIGSHLEYPFVYVPLNSFMSKWYGEAELRLSAIFEKIGQLAKEKGGAVIMIDEIDEIGGDREKSHEATGKITGVLLKKLDGMERIHNILLIGATNRKDRLDAALVSRFKYSQYFRLPNATEISNIVGHYLPEVGELTAETLQSHEGKLSGRTIKSLCEDVARACIQGEITGSSPNVRETFLKALARSRE